MPTPTKTRSVSSSIWPSWNEHKPYAVLLGILMVYLIVFLGAQIRETMLEGSREGYADRPAPSISVTATATATVATDIATVDLGITNTAATASLAQDDNTAKMNSMIAGIRALGIEDKDMKTSSYNIYPQYDYNQSPPAVVGYEASQTLTVKIRNTDLATAVVEAAGDLGATNIGSLRFEADDPTLAEAEARTEAIARAREQAITIAEAMGASLGRVVSYAESDSPGYYGYSLDARAGSGAPDLEPGEEEVIMTVYIDYALQ